MTEIADLIRYCTSRGGLNLSDVSRWLDAHRPTVEGWVSDGRDPRLHSRPRVLARLIKLKELVDARPVGECIPPSVKQNKRDGYITELKDATFGILTESSTR